MGTPPPRIRPNLRGFRRPVILFYHYGVKLLIWLYSSLIILWFLLYLIIADGIWWLGLINALALYLFLPLVLLVPLAIGNKLLRYSSWGSPPLIRHTRSPQRPRPRDGMPPGKSLLLSALSSPLWIPIIIFVGLWGKQFIPPRLKSPVQPQATFNVMTFNTLFNNTDTAKIADMLANTQPDILALQEIHPKNRDAVLAALEDYPYSVYHPNTDKHTIGLVSQFPILSSEPLAYPPLKRGLRVMIDVNGQPLQVIVTHLTPNLIKHRTWPQYIAETEAWFEQRDREMELLIQEIGVGTNPSAPYPTLLLCDCNMTRTSQNYRALKRYLADGFRDAGWGLGWSVFHPAFSFPIIRFDYVWHTPELEVVNSATGPDASSDHYPVRATVQFRKP